MVVILWMLLFNWVGILVCFRIFLIGVVFIGLFVKVLFKLIRWSYLYLVCINFNVCVVGLLLNIVVLFMLL